ncbi:MAG TPA: glutathione S-transferase family protein [Polyangiaceae bacterium]|jgi:glutathione S-transferase|nr:glutathione S-transferase family protein [Polyangiaceae bacterium]
MPLTLYFHPLASYCWKVLLALYESETPFRPQQIDLADPEERAALVRLWPVAKFPVLRDTARDEIVPESTIIIEYLALHYPGKAELLPKDADLAREVRLRDRFYDHYVHEPMQRIVGDRLRPADRRDPYGVEQAHAALALSYSMLEQEKATSEWATGSAFTLADCAAAPALYYANKVHPFGEQHPRVAGYLERLLARPSFARVLAEAEPYFVHFPG